MTPLVSVCVPSYNHAAYLPATLDSVLSQSLRDFEVVIVDDGSSDGSLEIAERYAAAHPDRIRLVTHPEHANRGAALTTNLAYESARGRFVHGVASDDMLYPDTLARAAGYLERHPGAGYVYGYAHLVDDTGARLPGVRAFGVDLTRGGRMVERLAQGNQIPGMTTMLRRECLAGTGGHDPALYYSDWDMLIRAAAHWDVGFIPRPLAMYRIHDANTGYNAARAVDVERSLEVTSSLRARAGEIGGRLAAPRVRATLELQHAFLLWAGGDRAAADAAVPAAFELDPRLAADGHWLADWLRARLLDRLMPDGGPGFEGWLVAALAPHLERSALRLLRRRAPAARQEAIAVRAAASGEMARARRAAVAAATRSPRALADRRIATLLIDSIGGGRPGAGLRRAKRRVLGYR